MSKSGIARSFVVTTVAGKTHQSRTWDARAPLALGHPIRWVLEHTGNAIRVRDLSARLGETSENSARELALDSLGGGASHVLSPNLQLLIAPGRAVDESQPPGRALPESPTRPNVAVTSELGRPMRGAGGALVAFVALAWLWPRPEPTPIDLVPAQHAKLVFSKPRTKGTTQAAAAQASGGSAAPKKAENTAVAQAFRARALQSAMSGLLRGGMTRLLAQSDFAAAPSAKQNRNMLDGRNDALRAAGADTSGLASRGVQVASLGGAGIGIGGKNVGYGKGERAGVSGQGTSQLAARMIADTGSADVEEGLNKDEVGAIIHKHLSEVRYCYESAILRTPEIEGKLMVSFTIGGIGTVKTTAVKSSTLPDPRLDDCILRRLVTWKFPNPRGGVDVAVTYPFIFKTLGR